MPLACRSRARQNRAQEDCSTADAASDPSGKGQARIGARCCSTGGVRGRVVIWGPSSPRSSAEERVVSTHLAGGSNPSGGTHRQPCSFRAVQVSARGCRAFRIRDSAAPFVVPVFVVLVLVVLVLLVMIAVVVLVIIVAVLLAVP